MSTLKTNNIQHVDRSDPSIIINTDGGVSIAGTLTYEDVTSVDAVGIVTGRELINAQKQIHVGTGVSVKAGGINVTAGITTVQALQATTGTFSGAVSGTTGTFTSPVLISDGSVSAGGLAFADDTDTGMFSVAQNTINFATAGVERLEMGTSLTVFNDGGADVDFRIEGDTDANLFKLDAGTDRIGLGVGAPSAKLQVLEDVYVKGSSGDGSVGIQIRSGASALSNQHQIRTGGGSGDQLFIEALGGSSAIVTKVAGSERLRIDSSGNVLTSGNAQLFGSNTSDGSDNKSIMINGGGSTSDTRGGYLIVHGNEHSSNPGITRLHAGNVGTAGIEMYTAGSERFKITSGGRILGGNHLNDRGAVLQIESSDHNMIGIHRNTADHGAPAMTFSASRGTSAGSNTIVQDEDYLGLIRFSGTDGVNLAAGAQITAIVDGTPGEDDMPARIAFWTSGDGSQSPTERMRISSGGVITLGNPTNTVLQAFVCNSVSGHQFISQCSDNNNGLEIYQKHGSTSTRNTFAAYANTGSSSSKKLQFAVVGDGNTKFDSGFGSAGIAYGCRAWVYINNTSGNMTLSGNGNVSSVSDLGAGAGQVFFSNAMPDTTYCVVSGLRRQATYDMLNVNFSNSTGNFRYDSFSNGSGSNADLQGYAFAVFR